LWRCFHRCTTTKTRNTRDAHRCASSNTARRAQERPTSPGICAVCKSKA
jgi:hypothetical protein